MSANTKINTKKTIGLILALVWIANCVIVAIFSLHAIWVPKMNAEMKAYSNIKADAFNGTSLPITHIPNWTNSALRDKSLDFRSINSKDIIPIPRYDINALQSPNNLIARFTYTVAYMGSYTLNYKENDGSHLGVDIRAPIGTPVLSIANGVVVRAVEADSTGNKFVVIRHDDVPVNGKIMDLYSGYLHLSEISVKEGTKIRKGEMLGRVGITGITTTPHLHFQIDTQDAPFHPYWPFTGSEARQAGMNIFQGVTAGLGADRAMKYTIHPMTFVQHYLNGSQTTETYAEQPLPNIPLKSLEEVVKFQEPEIESAPPAKSLEEIVRFQDPNDKKENIVVASTIVYNDSCTNNLNIDTNSQFGKNLQKLQNNTCAFNNFKNLSAQKTLTRGEAIIALMQYYKQNPETGISHFLDIPLTDEKLHGFAIKAYQNGIIKGAYLSPNKKITRGEFVEFLSRFGKLRNAPQNYVAYNDVAKTSSLHNSLNNYGYTIGVKNAKFSPDAALTISEAVNILNSLIK